MFHILIIGHSSHLDRIFYEARLLSNIPLASLTQSECLDEHTKKEERASSKVILTSLEDIFFETSRIKEINTCDNISEYVFEPVTDEGSIKTWGQIINESKVRPKLSLRQFHENARFTKRAIQLNRNNISRGS